jgi:hypothetical protein
VWSGPPAGPLQVAWSFPNRDGSREPLQAEHDGDRALVLGMPAERLEGARAWTLDAGAPLTRIPWATEAFVPVAIAGDHAGVIAAKPRRVALVDRATGAETSSRRVGRTSGTALDVSTDGRLVTATERGLVTLGAGAARLPGTRGLSSPRFAGGAIAAVRSTPVGSRVFLLRPDGSRPALGGPTAIVDDLAADDQGVAWIGNGCIRYAPIAGGPVPAPPPDAPCPHTEIGLYAIDSSRLRDRTVRVRVRCIAAPSDACRGTLLLMDDAGRVVARGPFSVPAGVLRRVPVRLSRAAVRIARREHGFLIDADVPGGRIWPPPGASELNIKGG